MSINQRQRADYRKAPIPTDWDGANYCLITICVPNSVQWIGSVRGILWKLSSGWNWARTDNPNDLKEAKRIGNEIYGSICIMCNLDTLINEQTKALKYIVAHLDTNGKVWQTLPDTELGDIYLRDNGILPVFSTSNTLFSDSGLTDLLQSSFIKYPSISLPLSGKSIADYLSQIDSRVKLFNEWLTTFYDLFNWYASSFRLGYFSDLNPFSQETFIRGLLKALGVEFPIIGLPDYSQVWSKRIWEAIRSKNFTCNLSTSDLEATLIGLFGQPIDDSGQPVVMKNIIDGIPVTINNRTVADLSGIIEVLKDLNIIAIAQSGDGTINLNCSICGQAPCACP